jgi:hypothetical protein
MRGIFIFIVLLAGCSSQWEDNHGFHWVRDHDGVARQVEPQVWTEADVIKDLKLTNEEFWHAREGVPFIGYRSVDDGMTEKVYNSDGMERIRNNAASIEGRLFRLEHKKDKVK